MKNRTFTAFIFGMVLAFTLGFAGCNAILHGKNSLPDLPAGTGTDGGGSNAGTPVQGDSTVDKLRWFSNNAQSGREYTITVSRDESLSPQTISAGGGNAKLTIRSSSANNIKALSLSGNGSLFTVSGGVTLTLENIELRGRDNNNGALVKINSGASLIINNGARITGNNNSSMGGGIYSEGNITINGGEIDNNISRSNNGGGIYSKTAVTMNGGKISNNRALSGGGVAICDRFSMHGGVISGNSATGYGGGVYLWMPDGSSFFKEPGGIIYGSDAGSGLANTCNTGAAVSCYNRHRRNTLWENDRLNTNNLNSGWD